MKKLISKIRWFFKSDRIIYSKTMLPGKKLFSFKTDTGKRYVCIAFTNKVKFKGMMPITDILFDDITAVRKLPSPFKKWLYRQVGKKARAIMYHFTDKKN